MGNEKRCAKTQPMDDIDVDTTKQIGRTFRDAGDDYDRFLGRRMGQGSFPNRRPSAIAARLLQHGLSAGFALHLVVIYLGV